MSDSVYGTHICPLVTAVMATKGDVFEMGCGDFSTPLLHAICKVQGRKLLSSDTDREWLRQFQDLETDWHKFVFVPVYNLKQDDAAWNAVGQQSWSVVFVDHRPGERRAHDIIRFKDLAEIIVVHDTETASYNYQYAFVHFKYQYTYKRYNVWTTLLSNKIDVGKLFQD